MGFDFPMEELRFLDLMQDTATGLDSNATEKLMLTFDVVRTLLVRYTSIMTNAGPVDWRI